MDEKPVPPAIVSTAIGVDPGFQYTGIAGLSRLSDGRLWSRGLILAETEKGRNGMRAGQDDARRMHELWKSIDGAFKTIQPNILGVESYTTRVPEAWDELKRQAERLINIGIPDSPEEFMRLLATERVARMWIETISKIAVAIRDAEGWSGMGLGNAAKTIGVQWIASTVAFQYGVPVFVYTPTMLKVRLCNNRRATKEDVGRVLESSVVDLSTHAAQIRQRTLRENPKSKEALDRVSHVHDAMGHGFMALEEFEKWRAAYRA